MSVHRAPLPLSVVVVAYDMAREVPRTLRSLSVPYQEGIDAADYEVIVVDNGSPQPLDDEMLGGFPGRLRVARIDPAPPSPARAANLGIQMAEGELIGLLIDGARLASPGLLAHALLANRLADRSIVAALGWHLGAELHMAAADSGYDQEVEDRLLNDIGWPRDGYRLFEISTLAASSRRGWFGPMGESNGLFLPAPMWAELDGLDERFALPGGGKVNHDLYGRACALDGSRLIVLLGEGTFHQLHGGAFTSGRARREDADREYESLRGEVFVPPDPPRLFVGTVPPQAFGSLEQSLVWARRNRS